MKLRIVVVVVVGVPMSRAFGYVEPLIDDRLNGVLH